MKWLVPSAIAATVIGSVAVEVWLLFEDSDLPGLPQITSHPSPLPPAPPSHELGAIMTASEAEATDRAVVTLHSAVSPQSTTLKESQPTESRIATNLPQIGPASGYGKIDSNKTATPAPPAIARLDPTPIKTPELPSTGTSESTPIAKLEPTPMTTPEPPSTTTSKATPIAKLEPTPQSPPINPAPPSVGEVVVVDRAGFLFADSNVRYLTRAELQGLSAHQLHIARNEIFARKGRRFKDSALRAYFSQFPWYQPHAWDVPLSPIEQANVKLVQSLEQTASASKPAATRAGRAPPM